ncbi:MAG: AI-2E family transporter [Chloroflexota bacterium]
MTDASTETTVDAGPGTATDPGTAAAPSPTRDLRLITSGPFGVLAAVVLILVAVLALREVADLVVPVLFGLFLALVTAPAIGWFERKGLRRPIALTVVVLIVLAGVVVVVGLIGLSVGELVIRLPRYEDRLTEAIAQLKDLLASFGVSTDTGAISSVVSPSQIVAYVRPIATAVGHTGASLFILAFTMIYALAGAGSMRARVEATFGTDHPLVTGVEQFGVDLRRYLLVRAELGAFAAVCSLVLLFVLGVPFPWLWAFLVLAASFIPNIGFIIALIPPTILAFLEGGLLPAVAVVAGYAVINFLQDHLLQPIVMGSELNLTPLVVMLSVIAWAWILGAGGALLAVPLTVGIVQVMEAFPQSAGLAAIMRNRASPEVLPRARSSPAS